MHTVPCEHSILLCTCMQHTHIYRIHTCIYIRTFVISSHPRHREMHVHYIVVNKLRTDWKIRTGKFKANFQFKLWSAIMLYHCFISRYQSLKSLRSEKHVNMIKWSYKESIQNTWWRYEMERFPCYCPFVRGSTDHQWIPLKGPVTRALMFYLMLV